MHRKHTSKDWFFLFIYLAKIYISLTSNLEYAKSQLGIEPGEGNQNNNNFRAGYVFGKWACQYANWLKDQLRTQVDLDHLEDYYKDNMKKASFSEAIPSASTSNLFFPKKYNLDINKIENLMRILHKNDINNFISNYNESKVTPEENDYVLSEISSIIEDLEKELNYYKNVKDMLPRKRAISRPPGDDNMRAQKKSRQEEEEDLEEEEEEKEAKSTAAIPQETTDKEDEEESEEYTPFTLKRNAN